MQLTVLALAIVAAAQATGLAGEHGVAVLAVQTAVLGQRLREAAQNAASRCRRIASAEQTPPARRRLAPRSGGTPARSPLCRCRCGALQAARRPPAQPQQAGQQDRHPPGGGYRDGGATVGRRRPAFQARLPLSLCRATSPRHASAHPRTLPAAPLPCRAPPAGSLRCCASTAWCTGPPPAPSCTVRPCHCAPLALVHRRDDAPAPLNPQRGAPLCCRTHTAPAGRRQVLDRSHKRPAAGRP